LIGLFGAEADLQKPRPAAIQTTKTTSKPSGWARMVSIEHFPVVVSKGFVKMQKTIRAIG